MVNVQYIECRCVTLKTLRSCLCRSGSSQTYFILPEQKVRGIPDGDPTLMHAHSSTQTF